MPVLRFCGLFKFRLPKLHHLVPAGLPLHDQASTNSNIPIVLATIDKYSTIWYFCFTLHYPLQDVIKKRTMWDGSPRDLIINPLPSVAMEVLNRKAYEQFQ
jgi:hypothetical protein